MEKIKRVKETTTKISDGLDLEIRDGKVSRPANTNQRDLQLKRPIPKDKIIPIYPVETIPPPGSHEPHLLDRQDAQARAAKK